MRAWTKKLSNTNKTLLILVSLVSAVIMIGAYRVEEDRPTAPGPIVESSMTVSSLNQQQAYPIPPIEDDYAGYVQEPTPSILGTSQAPIVAPPLNTNVGNTPASSQSAVQELSSIVNTLSRAVTCNQLLNTLLCTK